MSRASTHRAVSIRPPMVPRIPSRSRSSVAITAAATKIRTKSRPVRNGALAPDGSKPEGLPSGASLPPPGARSSQRRNSALAPGSPARTPEELFESPSSGMTIWRSVPRKLAGDDVNPPPGPILFMPRSIRSRAPGSQAPLPRIMSSAGGLRAMSLRHATPSTPAAATMPSRARRRLARKRAVPTS